MTHRDSGNDSTRCQHCGHAFNTRRALNVHLVECRPLPFDEPPRLPFDEPADQGDKTMIEDLRKWITD